MPSARESGAWPKNMLGNDPYLDGLYMDNLWIWLVI